MNIILFRSKDIMAAKIAIKLQSRRKRRLLGPNFDGEGIRQNSDMHFKWHLLPGMWSVLVQTVQRARRVADENQKMWQL